MYDGDTGQASTLEKTFMVYTLRFSLFACVAAFIMLLIVYFYYTVWMLEILAPCTHFIRGKVISV